MLWLNRLRSRDLDRLTAVLSAKNELAVEWRQDNATLPELVLEKLPPFPAFRRGMCLIAFEQVYQNHMVSCEQTDLRNASTIRDYDHKRDQRLSNLKNVSICPARSSKFPRRSSSP